MEKETNMPCPICHTYLIETRKPDWDNSHHMYAKFFYRCDKCCVDIAIDNGIVTIIDKNGKIVLSGK